MKTLILFGSARKEGNTKDLLNYLMEELEGEVEIIDAYRTEVTPCKDCRYCWHKRGCSIKDNMQEIYKKIDAADNIVIASPMYFHTVPGPLKTLIDRCQVYWAGMLRKDHAEIGTKKGAVLMCGGAPSFENQFLAGEIVLKGLLGDFRAECLGVISAPYTDKCPVRENEEIITKVKDLAIAFNNANKKK